MNASFFSDGIRVRYLRPQLPEIPADRGQLIWTRRLERARTEEAAASHDVAILRYSAPENHGLAERHAHKLANQE